MRIGLVTPSWPGGDTANGITTAVVHLASGLEEAGHGVTIIPLTPAGGDDPRVVDLPAARPWTFLEGLGGRLGQDVVHDRIVPEQFIHAARTAITRDGIEALIIEETQGWAGPLQQALDIPVVVTLHGPWFLHRPLHEPAPASPGSRRREIREGAALSRCAGITAPSRDVLDRTVKRYGLADIRQAVIRNPMTPEEPLDYDGLGDDARRRLLFIGRFDLHKGGDVVLDGFRMLVEQNVDAMLTFVGPDPGLIRADGRRRHIGEALAALPPSVRERIDYRGPLPKDEIADLRRRHVTAIVASRYENLNYTMLESLATGAATICTAVGGQAEIIHDNKTGLLIPPNDPAALAAACRRLIEDPDLAARLGAAAYREIAETFAPSRIAGEMVGFLAQVLAQRH